MSELELEFIVAVEKEEDEGYYDLAGGPYSLVLAKRILPERGQFRAARYRVTLTFTSDQQGTDDQTGPTTSLHECRAVRDSGIFKFLSDSEIQGYIGLHQFGDDTNSPAVDWDPTDGYVSIQVEYDPGMSCTAWHLEQESHPDPELGYVTSLTQDIDADYRGRVVGTATEQRFPHAIEYCLTYDELTFVVLDRDADGVADPTVTDEDRRNLFAIDTSGTIAWTAPVVTRDSERYFYQSLWRVNGHLLTTMYPIDGGDSMTVKLDPATGEIIAKDL